MAQIRVPTFIFENLTYREKVRALRHFRPITPSARNVGPPRSKRCDGKSISLRQKATLKDHSEARPAACLAAVNGQHTVFNADTGSHSFFSYETVECNIPFRLTCLSSSVALQHLAVAKLATAQDFTKFQTFPSFFHTILCSFFMCTIK